MAKFKNDRPRTFDDMAGVMCASRSPQRRLACKLPDGHDKPRSSAANYGTPHQSAGGITWGNVSGYELHGYELQTQTAPPPPAPVEPHPFIIPKQRTSPEVTRRLELSEWWRHAANDEIERTVPKSVEYGATDLIDIGRDLARCAGRQVADEEAAELGVYFYLRGKLARWTDAVVRGERPSDDTLFDIGVYVRMAQRIRAAGGWPGKGKSE